MNDDTPTIEQPQDDDRPGAEEPAPRGPARGG